MDYVLVLCLLFGVLSSGCCAQNHSEFEKAQVRKRETTFRDLMACGLTRDVSCFLDVGDVLVEEKMGDVLALADQEVSRTSGRSEDEESPSQLSKAISRIVSELTDMFKDSLAGFFKSAREGEEEDEVEEAEDDKEEETRKSGVGEARKKKKKGKLIALIKLIILGLVLKAKITLLLKALSAALQVKFFLVALAGLILNAARFYLDLKKGHQPQKVIYYEHAQHQHHYEGDDDWSSAPGGGYWGRSYEEEEAAQDLAYSKQKPQTKKDKSALSWLG